MPRDGSGVYSLPAGNPVVTLTTITSAWANTTMSDVATALTQSLATTGVTSMTGPLKVVDGVVGAPGLAWAAETTSGWYRISANSFGFSVGGNLSLSVNSSRAWSIAAPTAGVALKISSFAGTSGLDINQNSGTAHLTFSRSAAVVGYVGTGELVAGAAAGDIVVRTIGTAINFSVDNGTSSSVVIANTGAMTVKTPSSGVALTVNAGAAGVASIRYANSIADGTDITLSSSGTSIILAQSATWTALDLRTAGNSRIQVGSAGNTTINAPSSGVALAVTGVAGAAFVAHALQVQSPNTAGQSNGIRIIAGTNSTDYPLMITNAAGTVNQWIFAGDGSLSSSGQPPLGLGAINAVGFYIGGNQLFFGVPASANSTAAVTDVGKCINAGGNITINNAVFSQGHAFAIYNNTAASITIIAGITTMRLAGTTTTGTRTLAARGMASVWFEGSSECIVSGSGVS